MLKSLSTSLKTIYKYRELIISLVVRELKGRYRGSAIGVVWTLLNPLLLLLVYALVFTVYMRVQMENYTVFMFCGLLPWIWFSSSIMEGVNSITSAGNLITKSMFPAETLPMVKIISNLVNYLLSLPLLFIFMLWFGTPISLNLIWLPFIVLAQLIFTVGLVYLFSSLNVRFRDIQHILGNLLVLWFFLCPIIYPVTSAPAEWRFTFYLNPMAILSIAYQDIFIYARAPEIIPVMLVMLGGALLTLVGFRQFEISKDTFAEEI